MFSYSTPIFFLNKGLIRERKEDIKALAEFFLKKHIGVTKRQLKLAPTAIQALTLYSWPGNIRELQNIIERVIAIYHHETIDAAAINLMLYDPLESKALTLTNGKYAEAAKLLGISRSTLWRKLKRLGLK